MKVLVVGASGFLGLSAVRALAAGAHEVVGLVRSEEKGRAVRAAGASPFVGDIQSIPSLVEAGAGCTAFVHAAASATSASREIGQSTAAKVRVDGAYNLVAAARKVGGIRLLVVSGTWLMGDHKEPLTEHSPVKPTGKAMFNWQAERAAIEANKPGGLEVVVIRPGMVYGDGSWFAEMVNEIRGGTYRVPGEGANLWSPLHIDDCGAAIRAVLERGKPGEAYLAADDEPMAVRAFADLIADAAGAPRPALMSMDEAVSKHGAPTAAHLAANQAVVNTKLKELGWAPHYPRARDCLPAVVRAMKGGTP